MENNCSTCIRLRDNRRGITSPKRMNEKFCRKCKDAEKASIIQQKRDELKEQVKINPQALLDAPLNFWSEAAMRTVVEKLPSVGITVANTYPQTGCYYCHDAVRRDANIKFFTESFNKHLEEKKAAEAARRAIEAAERAAREAALLPLRKEQLKSELLRKAARIPEWNSGFAYLMLHEKAPPPTSSILDYNEFLELVKQHPGVLEFVPLVHRTYELCMEAMKAGTPELTEHYKNCGECFPMVHIPGIHRDEEMCLTAASWSYYALWCFPPKMRTLEMYKKVAMVNPDSIFTTMPEPFCKHPEILAIKKHGAVFI